MSAATSAHEERRRLSTRVMSAAISAIRGEAVSTGDVTSHTSTRGAAVRTTRTSHQHEFANILIELFAISRLDIYREKTQRLGEKINRAGARME